MESEQKSLPYIPGLNDPETRRTVLPEPEAEHIISGEEPLIVLEYPEHLRHGQAEDIKADLDKQGVKRHILLDGGAHLNLFAPKAGEVVVLRVDCVMSDEQTARATRFIRETFAHAGLGNPVLVLDSECRISSETEATMRQLGWVRAEDKALRPVTETR